MLADVGQQLAVSSEIVTTTLRPELVLWSNTLCIVYVIELALWEGAIEARERKRLRRWRLRHPPPGGGWLQTHQGAQRARTPRSSPVPDHKRNIGGRKMLQPMAMDQEGRPQLGPKMLRSTAQGRSVCGGPQLVTPDHPTGGWQIYRQFSAQGRRMGQSKAVLHLVWSFKLEKEHSPKMKTPSFSYSKVKARKHLHSYVCLSYLFIRNANFSQCEDALRLNQVHHDKTHSPACWSGVQNIVHG